MITKEEVSLVSPCGIYCAECSMYKAKDNPELKDMLISMGMKAESIPCPGCRAMDGNCPHLESRCENYICAEEKDVLMCFECEDFPCIKLHPAADRANTLPHNIKLFSQLYIQKHGVEAWKKHLPEMRKRYFSGKISFGKGPLLDD